MRAQVPMRSVATNASVTGSKTLVWSESAALVVVSTIDDASSPAETDPNRKAPSCRERWRAIEFWVGLF